jgi:hypothetical protein
LTVPRETVCPECGCRLRIADGADPAALTCPGCLAPLAPPGGVPSAGHQYRWDLRTVQRGLLILAGLCVLGAIVASFPREGTGLVMLLTLALDILAVVFIAIVVFRRAARPAPSGLVFFGRMVVGVVVFIVASVAAVIIFFFACAALVITNVR